MGAQSRLNIICLKQCKISLSACLDKIMQKIAFSIHMFTRHKWKTDASFYIDPHYLTQYECRAVSTARYKSWHWIAQVLEILITFHYFHGIFSFTVKRDTWINVWSTGRIQFKVLTTLPMIISSFLLEFKGFWDKNWKSKMTCNLWKICNIYGPKA